MVDLLKTPEGWPTILLERRRRRGPDRPRRRGAGRRVRRRCGASIRNLGGDRDDRDDRRVRPARPGRRRLPGRGQVAAGGGHGRAAPLRRGQRLRRGPGDRHGPLPARARPVRGHRGRGDRRLRDRRRARSIIAVRADADRGDPRGSRPPSARPRRRASSASTSSAPGTTSTVTVRPVQGAYMLGEETVLLKALEGKRGQPEQRPPHPAERGLFDMPTVVHNVQTLAAVPWIIRNGAEAFAAIGAPDSPGTILVQVRTPAGDGIAEVPLGTPLRDVVGARRPAAGRSLDQGRPRRRPVRRPAAARPARHAVRLRAAARRRRPRRLGLGRRRRRSRLHRRPGPPADPLLRRRGVRQDDPVPDRDPPAGRDRRSRRRGPAAPDRPDPARPTCRPTSSPPPCATTSA